MKMPLCRVALILAVLVAGAAGFLSASSAAEGDLVGKWKFVMLPYGDDEFAIIDAKMADGKLQGEIVAVEARVLPEATVKSLTVEGDAVTLTVVAGGQELQFSGRLGEGQASPARGTAKFRGGTYPARLEKTESDTLAPLGQSKITADVGAALGEADAKTKIAKLQEVIKTHAGAPALHNAYVAILRSAAEAEWSNEQVAPILAQWFDEAKPYGDAWVAEMKKRAAATLVGQEKYGATALTLVEESLAALPADAGTEAQADLYAMVASAARAAGASERADEADRKLAELEKVLDEEYLKTTPPFAPKKFAGRQDAKANQVVLMELFTGAQCPPCVAADVGFDALLSTYEPTEFIGLQYHLHIPGPDPLTNEDAVVRSQYYSVPGTPATYFNGASEAGGGGGMAQSEDKYAQFQAAINQRLESVVTGELKLDVQRSGDKISVRAAATMPEEAKQEVEADAEADSDPDAKEEEAKPRDLRLRLVVTEEVIKYVGGNRLRFHHHVVRGMPGGAEGAAFTGEKGAAEATIDLAELRTQLDAYLDAYAKDQAFPKARPPIALEKLSIVAFVQDDASKEVLQAVLASVPE